MRILIVGGMFPPMRTGTSFYTLNVATALARLGHAVEVVSLGEVYGVEAEGDLRIHRLPAKRLPLEGFFKHFRVCSPIPANWSRLHRIAKEFRPDVMLLVNHYLDIAFPAAYAARRCGVPLVCSVGTQLQSLNPRRDHILNVLDRLVCGHLVFPFCASVIAWDTQILQYLRDVHGERVARKTTIVNYGVNGEPERLLAFKNDHRYRGVVLGVGAVSEQRSFVPLVRAFARLSERFPELRLRIVGHVYYDEAVKLSVELGVAERVTFLGEKAHDQVVAEMQGADALYSSLTGKYVGLGTATIEAMLLAVPAVVNTPLELLGTGVLEDGQHIIQAVSPDPEEIAERIGTLLRDDAMRARVGNGGRAFVRQYLDWDVVARDMTALFGRVAGGGHA